GHRPPSATCRNCDGSVLVWLRAPEGTFTICPGLSAFNWRRCSDTSASWIVDSGLRNLDRSPASMGCLFWYRGWNSHHVGNVGHHPGDDWTWCLVHRCASVRPEAYRDFRALDSFSHPLKWLAPLPTNGRVGRP